MGRSIGSGLLQEARTETPDKPPRLRKLRGCHTTDPCAAKIQGSLAGLSLLLHRPGDALLFALVDDSGVARLSQGLVPSSTKYFTFQQAKVWKELRRDSRLAEQEVVFADTGHLLTTRLPAVHSWEAHRTLRKVPQIPRDRSQAR